jgi:dihydroorotate dehydrogenase (NAD+) catalytic subunit
MNLGVKKGRLDLASPLVGASGLFGYGTEHEDILDYESFGAIVTKTITLAPREGNPPPRLVDVGSGIINSIGLENVGADAFMREHLPGLKLPCKVFVSIGGAKVEEYAKLASMLDEWTEAQVEGSVGGKGDAGEGDAGPIVAGGFGAIEVNISCPNVKQGGIAFGQDAESAREVVSAVRETTRHPLIVKLPPLISGIEKVCVTACDAGADALTVANTYPAMAIDIDRAKPVLGALSGGLSGGAIKPVSLLLVWKAARSVDVPVLAGGGIETASDAVEYILAGAHALQIGSVILKDTQAPARILAGLRRYMKEHGHKSIDDFRGKAAE